MPSSFPPIVDGCTSLTNLTVDIGGFSLQAGVFWRVTSTSTPSAGHRVGDYNFGPNQYSEIRQQVAAGGEAGVVVRMNPPDSFYYLINQFNANQMLFGVCNAGSFSTIATSATRAVTNSLVRLEVVGNTFYCYENHNLRMANVVSSPIVANGYPGVYMWASSVANALIDRWEAGGVPSTWAPGNTWPMQSPYQGRGAYQNYSRRRR